jgi:hypothetical protein
MDLKTVLEEELIQMIKDLTRDTARVDCQSEARTDLSGACLHV